MSEPTERSANPNAEQPLGHDVTQSRGNIADSSNSTDTVKDTVKDPLRASRTSGLFVAVTTAAAVLVLLVVFIVQNTQRVEVSYLGWDGTAPLAASLLVAAAAGMIITILAASLRLLQVRRRVRRDRKH